MKFKESENFSDFSLYRIFESENFKGSLLYEKLPKVGSEKRKIILSKIQENLLDKLRKIFVRGTAGRLEIFSLPWDRENSSQFLRLRKDIFTENSR